MLAPVEIVTLGRFEVRVDGSPLTFGRKAPRRPLLLLKALVAAGRGGAGEAALADALWPDADGDAAAGALATTLHRLRRLLRHPGAVVRQEGRISLEPRVCRVDTWAVERLLGEAEAAGLRGRADERVRLTLEALTSYPGPFLPADADEPWSAAPRERLRSRLVRVLVEAGRDAERIGRIDAAAHCYQRALELDDCAEAVYQRLLALYQRLGQRAEAVALYARCRERLAAVLGLEPAPATRALLPAPPLGSLGSVQWSA